MFAFLRLRREARARHLIRAAIAAHESYERDRIARRGADHGFMHDQRVRAVRQRVERMYVLDQKQPPANLPALVEQEVGPSP